MTKNLQAKNSRFKIEPVSSENWYVFDIESDGLYDSVTKVFCIVLHDLNGNQTHSYGPDAIDDALRHLASADVLIGHNILFYDLPVLEKLFQFQFKGRAIDTLICTRLIWPKEILFELDENHYESVPKGIRGSASLKAWGYRLSDNKIEFKDFTAFSQEMLDYCIQDVSVTSKLFKFIANQNYPLSSLELEHEFAICINRQIRAGIPFDVDKCLDLVDALRTKKNKLEYDLKLLFEPTVTRETFIPKVNNAKRGYVKGRPFTKTIVTEFNPGSRKQIAEKLKSKYGWTPEKTTDKGNPVLDDEVLEKLPYSEAKALSEYMLIKKRLGQLAEGKNAWLKLVNDDTGCMHGDVVTNGCITGRCSHRNPNMAQVPAGYSPYGKECRELFHADQGWDLVGVDAKALELRCLAGYLALWDNGEYANLVVDPDSDIHTYNQQQFGVATRDISKRLLYGMLYGCGSAKAGTIIDPNEKNTTVLTELGKTAINSFMKGVPALQKLKNQVESTIHGRGYLIGLDNRVLHCRSAFKGLNVLLQSAGALLMKQVVIFTHANIEKNLGLVHGQDWKQVLMIHDEIQIMCNKKYTEAIQEQALLAFPQAQQFFNFKCLIEGDSRVGFNWSETH